MPVLIRAGRTGRNLVPTLSTQYLQARRTEEHNNLVSEVTKQLTPRFLAQPAMIKKRIESLIERDFLERRDGDRQSCTHAIMQRTGRRATRAIVQH